MTDIDLSSSLLQRFADIVGDRYALRDQTDIAPYLIERRGLWHGRTPLVLRPGRKERRPDRLRTVALKDQTSPL